MWGPVGGEASAVAAVEVVAVGVGCSRALAAVGHGMVVGFSGLVGGKFDMAGAAFD